jgi:hypothetical protein
MNREQNFYLTADHIKLLREFVVIWDMAEAGAPVIDPSRPYGSSNRYSDMARILGLTADGAALSTEQKSALDQLYQDMTAAFEIALQHGRLMPGEYSYTAAASFDEETELELPGELVTFYVTNAHAKLLNGANGVWLEYWETLGINSKRPYGDMTSFELDMANILEMPISNGVDLTLDQVDQLQQLHSDMIHTLPILLKYGALQTGHYYRASETDPWQFVSMSEMP